MLKKEMFSMPDGYMEAYIFYTTYTTGNSKGMDYTQN